MAKTKLYIALTLDGYIAHSNGSVDFLNDYSDHPEVGNHYFKFMDTISDVVMGRITYEQVKNELSVGEWPYQENISHIFTKQDISSDNEQINIVNDDLGKYINDLKTSATKDIFIIGGAKIVNELLKDDLIDEITLTLVPKIIGGGIKMFDINENKNFKLIKTKKINDLMYLTYVSK